MPPASLEPGTILGGKFRIVRLLGQGGMGAVLEAENTVTHKRVAIKWMHPELATRGEGVQRFLQEAQASARVVHPNVVDVYDVVREGDAVFMVMELLEGEPLSATMERGDLPLHKLFALLIQAMQGVAAAHRQGIVHRDIKPDNIFLAREQDRNVPVPKVLDFGISKVQGAANAGLTRTGTAMGTPMYMSYEQLCNAKDIDGRTDVYAFGVILYEAATGKQPFEAEAFTELAIKIATTEPIAPKLLRPDLPTSLERLIQWAMAKNRDQRIASMDALIAELEPFASEHGFRGEMTIAHAEQPRVAARSERPRTPPSLSTNPRTTPAPMLDTLGNRSSPAMRSQVELDSVPIQPLVPRWLPAAAAGLVLIALMAGGYVVWSSKSAPQAASASAPPPPVLSAPKPPVAAALAPTAEAEPHRMQPQAPAPSPSPEPAKQPEASRETARLPSAASGRSATPARETDKRTARVPVEPRTVAPAEKPAPRPAARQAGQDGFRAGTPRGEDF